MIRFLVFTVVLLFPAFSSHAPPQEPIVGREEVPPVAAPLLANCDPKAMRPLSVLRREWNKLASSPTSEAKCSDSERLWFVLMLCFREQPNWQPSVSEVGDCWVQQQALDRARTFYENALRLKDRNCTWKGYSPCDVYAAEELRALACGYTWLKESPTAVWTALKNALERSPSGEELPLPVKPWRGGQDFYYADPPHTNCWRDSFSPLKSMLKAREQILTAIAEAREAGSAAEELRIVIPTDVADLHFMTYVLADPRSNSTGWSGYTHFVLQICRYQRSTPVEAGAYYLDVDPISQEDLKADRFKHRSTCPN